MIYWLIALSIAVFAFGFEVARAMTKADRRLRDLEVRTANLADRLEHLNRRMPP